MLRRTFLILSFSTALTSCGGALDQFGLAERRLQRQVNDALDNLAKRELSLLPEVASQLGLSLDQAGYDYRGQLNDYSQAGFERHRLVRLEMLETLTRLPLPAAGSSARVNLEILRAIYEQTVTLESRGRGRVRLGYARPYALDQLSGVYLDGPDFLAQQHTLRSPQDASAFLDRLSQLPIAIRGERGRLLSDAKEGTIPPKHILTLIRQNIDGLISVPVEEMNIISTFDGLLSGIVEISPAERRNYVRRAVEILKDNVLPAYDDLLVSIELLIEDAPESLGLWAQQDGDAFYADLLRQHTGTELSPNDVFEMGETLVARYSADIAQSLDQAGFPSEDSIGQRLSALAALEDQAFDPDPEIARQQILDQLEEEIRRAQAALSQLVDRPPSTPIDIRQVPELRQQTAPTGYYQIASVDGAPLGIFHVNLRSTEDWARFTLPTLAYHEGYPGHHLDTAIMLEDNEAALLRRMIWLPSYGEGWALYAEDLADELGFYDNRPLARIGYLQSLLFRSARLVVDVGIHAKRWSRDEAIDYLIEVTGQPREAMEREVDRYAVWPGQSASYMIGRDQIVRLRRRAEAVLGDQFDLPTFHDVILSKGPRPQSLIEQDVDQWLAQYLS